MNGHEGRLVTSDERPEVAPPGPGRMFRAECECGYVGPWKTTNAAMGSHHRHTAALRGSARTEFPAIGDTSTGRGELAGGDVQAVRFSKKRRRPTRHDQTTPLPGDPGWDKYRKGAAMTTIPTQQHDHPDYVHDPECSEIQIHKSLCGLWEGTVDGLLVHTGTCLTCRTIARSREAAKRPSNRSIATRRNAVADARATLRQYTENVSDEADPLQVQRLAWAISHLTRAMWHETRGAFGDKHAYALKTLDRLEVPK